MPDSTLSRRSAALLRVDLGDRRSIRGMNFTRKLQKTPFKACQTLPAKTHQPQSRFERVRASD